LWTQTVCTTSWAEPNLIATTATLSWHLAAHRDRTWHGDVHGIISRQRLFMPGRCWVQVCSPAHAIEHTCQRCMCTHAACRHGLRESMRCSWKSRRVAPRTDPSHRRRWESAVGSSRSMCSLLGVRHGQIWLSDLIGYTPHASTEGVMRSASSPVHSPKVRACTDAMSSDGRHRRRPCGAYPIGSDAFRYFSSDPTLLGLRLLYELKIIIKLLD
jgi:hypothetical protein